MGTSYYSSSCGPFLYMSYRPLLWKIHNVAVVLDLPSNHLGNGENVSALAPDSLTLSQLELVLVAIGNFSSTSTSCDSFCT
eukprot:11413992-Ditylum_brightwellii.AAC.1